MLHPIDCLILPHTLLSISTKKRHAWWHLDINAWIWLRTVHSYRSRGMAIDGASISVVTISSLPASTLFGSEGAPLHVKVGIEVGYRANPEWRARSVRNLKAQPESRTKPEKEQGLGLRRSSVNSYPNNFGIANFKSLHLVFS